MEDAREQIPLTTSTPHQKGSFIGIKHFTTCEPLEACSDAQTGIDQTIQKELSVRARRKLQNRNAQRNLRLRRAQEQQQQQQLQQQQEQGQEQQSQHQPQEQPEQQPQQQLQHQPNARSTQPPAAQRFEQEDKWSEGPRKSSKYTPSGELDSSTSPPRQHSPIRYEHPLSDDFLPTLVDLDEFAPWDTYPLSPVLSCSTTAQKVDPSVFPLQASHRGVHAAYCGGGPGHEQFVACECGQQTCNPPVESFQSLACVQGVKSGGSMAAPGSLEGSHMRLAPRQGPQVIQVPTPKSPAPRRMSHSCKPAVLSSRIPKETHMPDSWQRSVTHPPNFQRRSSSCTRRRSNGKTTLHLSAAKGHGKIVRYLLNSGTEPDTPDGAGLTALHHAARNGHTEVAAILLEKGADIEATNRQGWTALHMAADLGWEDILRLLVEEGANLGARIEDAGLSDVSPE